jgi:hypothetical protein
MNRNYFAPQFEKFKSKHAYPPGRKSPRYNKSAISPYYNGFRCANCRAFVSTEPIISGVKNRNHCLFCLWSIHVDLIEVGDRLAACKENMKPIGLTLKKTRKKYGEMELGELMIIHCCVDCGKISINRIAADDDQETIYNLFACTLAFEPALKVRLENDGILVLKSTHKDVVYARLFGYTEQR